MSNGILLRYEVGTVYAHVWQIRVGLQIVHGNSGWSLEFAPDKKTRTVNEAMGPQQALFKAWYDLLLRRQPS